MTRRRGSNHWRSKIRAAPRTGKYARQTTEGKSYPLAPAAATILARSVFVSALSAVSALSNPPFQQYTAPIPHAPNLFSVFCLSQRFCDTAANSNTVHLRVPSRRFPDGRLGSSTC
jgi:hypothetical protein